MKQKYFSLMELIVVCKLILIVGVLLMLAVGNIAVGRRAVEVSCRDKLRDIGVAIMLYEDQFGVMPYAYNTDIEPSSYKMWCGLLFNAGLLKVNGATYWGANAINCPELACPQSQALNAAKDYYHYGMNVYLPNLTKIPESKGHRNWYRASVRSTEISKPSQRILVGDAVHFLLGGPSKIRGLNGSARYPHENNSMNAVFLDGRVENLLEKNMKNYHDYATMFARY